MHADKNSMDYTVQTGYHKTHKRMLHAVNATGTTHLLIEKRVWKKRKSARERALAMVCERWQFCHAHWAHRSMVTDDS